MLHGIGLPIAPKSDFGVMNRHAEGDPVLYNHQFYSNILKGIFALDIDQAGTFTPSDKPVQKTSRKISVKSAKKKA